MGDLLSHIPLEQLCPPKVMLRPVRRSSVEFTELINSIKTDGVLQSILVRPCEDGYEVVEGEHRRQAAKLADLKTIPCIVREMDDQEALIIQLKANAVRPQETQPYEYARRLKKLLDDGMTLAGLSSKIDKSPDWVRKMLRLINLRDEAIPHVNQGDIPLKSAMALATLPIYLQEKFVDDAVIMKPQCFVTRANKARLDYEAQVTGQKYTNLKKGIWPSIRPLAELKSELEGFTKAQAVIKESGCVTPLDGWKACLAWMLRVDPDSIEKRKKKNKGKNRNVYMTSSERADLYHRLALTVVSEHYLEKSHGE